MTRQSDEVVKSGGFAHNRRETKRLPFRWLFESVPGMLLDLSTPEFRIAAANDVYLRATMTERKNIVGKLLFEVFPDNPGDADTAGTRILQDSLKRVLRTRLPDALAVQKYDIRRPDSEGGGFEERYWSIDNSPVVGNDGEVAFIINRAEDVTEYVRLKQHRVEEHQQTVLIRPCAQQMEEEIYRRAQEVQTLNLRLRDANNALELQIAEARTRRAAGRGDLGAVRTE